jgi:hypothetical protein
MRKHCTGHVLRVFQMQMMASGKPHHIDIRYLCNPRIHCGHGQK